MHKLKSLTPLGADLPRVDQIGTLTISEVVDQAMVSVAARTDQLDKLHAAILKHHDLSLPDVGQVASTGVFSALWTGHEQWMILAPHDSHELLATELKQVLGQTASVVEQTDGWCRFDVEGDAHCDFFERLTNVPVRNMTPGSVVRGTIEHMGAFIWRLTDSKMAVIAPRSSAASLHHALISAAHSVA
ncbi:hypothetical protein MWU76_19545 [Gelidibacter sp. F2691]|nr:hypothetical protein [Gelidibacter sp. F2691]